MQRKNISLAEPSCYAEVYRRYAPALLAYAYRRLSSREDAEDVIVEVFLSILQNEHFLVFDEKKQEAWLWTITRNKVVDAYRRAARLPQVSVEWLSEVLYEDEGQSPEWISIRREEDALLQKIVRELPELQQEVLRLRFGDDLKFEEIARVLEKNEPAIRMLLTRTLRRLRSLFRDGEKAVNDERT